MRAFVRSGRRLGAALALLAGTALLASASSAADYPRAIQALINGSGVKVEKRFPAASGLTGWVVKHQGGYALVFTTADGNTLINGTVVDAQGRNLTAEYINKYVPKPDYKAAFKKLENTTYVTEGTQHDPKSVLYVFTDANCPYCHAAWKALRPYQEKGLQVRWVPVAVLRPSSVDKAVAILAAKDREAAFRRDMEHFGQRVAPATKITPAERTKYKKVLNENVDLMSEFGINGTPGIVWRDAKGKISIKRGMPKLSEIPAMTGLPHQANNDPDLARFN
ncbi:MAG TPA: thiol:disulfide interchange protein DsbG [Gammaproteobacteria bacterium]|nr:thiol:disulfide interchange protein DsbG [Gammaproteobacteria bacterium]